MQQGGIEGQVDTTPVLRREDQGDAAIVLWKELLSATPRTPVETLEQTKTLRAAISVSVRAKDDPKLTLELLESMKGRKDLPAPFSLALAEWTRQTRAWSEEGFVASAQSTEALVARARALIAATHAASAVAPDEGQLIWLLRASAYLNTAFAREPLGKWRGEGLYLLGVASAATLDPELWEIDGLYLEACVRENPHSGLAVLCVGSSVIASPRVDTSKPCALWRSDAKLRAPKHVACGRRSRRREQSAVGHRDGRRHSLRRFVRHFRPEPASRVLQASQAQCRVRSFETTLRP